MRSINVWYLLTYRQIGRQNCNYEFWIFALLTVTDQQHVDGRQHRRWTAAVRAARQDATDGLEDPLPGSEWGRQGQLDVTAQIHTWNAGRFPAWSVVKLCTVYKSYIYLPLYVSICVSAIQAYNFMFLIISQAAGPIGTKLGTRIHLDPESFFGKSRSRSRSERRRRENGGAVGADSLRPEYIYKASSYSFSVILSFC